MYRELVGKDVFPFGVTCERAERDGMRCHCTCVHFSKRFGKISNKLSTEIFAFSRSFYICLSSTDDDHCCECVVLSLSESVECEGMLFCLVYAQNLHRKTTPKGMCVYVRVEL